MEQPRTHVIVNPAAADGRAGRLWPHLKQALAAVLPAGWRYTMTSGPRQAPEIARQVVMAGSRLLVSVGGDGTLNEVVNGFFSGSELLTPDLLLAVVPIGTGGDYCKTFGIDSSWQEAVARLRSGAPHLIDLGRLTCMDHQGREVMHHFVNIASFGASGLIDEKVNNTTKILGGKASFLIGTIRGLLEYRNQRVRLTVDDYAPRDMLINTVAVAIGRCFGGGMRIAAQAAPDDGLFDIVILSNSGILNFLKGARKLYRGTHLREPDVELIRGRLIKAESNERVLIDMDGETPGRLPATFEILHRPIRLWY